MEDEEIDRLIKMIKEMQTHPRPREEVEMSFSDVESAIRKMRELSDNV